MDETEIEAFLHRRLVRFSSPSVHLSQNVLRHFRYLGKRFKPCILSATVFTVLNGWCTNSRFGGDNHNCPFCGETGYAFISHMVVCPQLQNFVLPGLHQSHAFLTAEHIFEMCSGSRDLDQIDVDFIAIYVYIALRVFNSCRHGDSLTQRLVTHLLKRLAFHCQASRYFLQQLYNIRLNL